MKKKELKDQKLKFKNEERNLAPNRGQKEAFWAPKRAPKESQNRVEKTTRKKRLEKKIEPHQRITSIHRVSARDPPGIRQGSAKDPPGIRPAACSGVWGSPKLKLKLKH